MGSIRIFIVSADERLRLALIMFLELEPYNFVIGMSDRLIGLLAQLEASDADVLLLDWDLPTQSPAERLAILQGLEGQPKSIVLSSRQKNKGAIMAAGANYFISKSTSPEELIPILNEIRLAKSAC